MCGGASPTRNMMRQISGPCVQLSLVTPTCSASLTLSGQSPPHMDYAQDTKYPEVIRMAHDRGITVNAVQAGGARDTERVWRDIAQRGDGRYIPIPQDGGQIVIIETPWDTE